MTNRNDSLDLEKTVERADNSLGNEKTISGGAVCGVVDRYELIEKLGQGGFGAVYRARDTEAGVEVALKALPPLISHSPDEMQSVRANFALVSKLVHSGIANLKHLHKVEQADAAAKQALGVSSGDYLVVMEYVPGSTLSAWRTKFPNKQVPVFQALEICRQIAEALDYAHSQKIIHRDIKPSNIMLSQNIAEVRGQRSEDSYSPDTRHPTPDTCTVKVLDFGLAAEIRSSMSRVSQEQGDSSGTRPYMAPEQWTGRRQGAQTDQYALAILFYELVSGAVPFQSVFETGDMQLMRDVVKTEAVEPLEDLDTRQNAIVLRALSKEPQERFSSCIDFINALAGIRGQRSGVRKSPRKAPKGTKKIIIGLIAAGLLGSGVFLGVRQMDAASKRNTAMVALMKQEAIQAWDQVKGYDRGQGFGERLDAVRRQLDSGVDLFDNQKDARSAHDCFQTVLDECKCLRGLEDDRKDAKTQRQGAENQQMVAKSMKADGLARKVWSKAIAASLAGVEAFDKGDFEEASSGWKSAAELFQGSGKVASAYSAAETQKAQMYRSRLIAENAEANSLAQTEWQQGVASAVKAEQEFKKDNFEQASKHWKIAAEFFQTSEKRAISISEYRKAKGKWELTAAELTGRDPDSADPTAEDLSKYAAEEWQAAQKAAHLGETFAGDPVQGKHHYETALTKYAESVGKTIPLLVPSAEVSATIDGKEVEAMFYWGGEKKTPTIIQLEKGRQYDFGIRVELNGQNYQHTFSGRANWKGKRLLTVDFALMKQEGDFKYTLINEVLTLARYTGRASVLKIPSTLGGEPVSAIGEDAFANCKSLTSVTIPDSIMSIKEDAFYGCDNLTSITIPNSVTEVGRAAFAYCHGLTSISISENITEIREFVFASCDMTAIIIPASVISIEKYAFSGCDSLRSITIPDSVISIGEGALSGCSNLRSITIPDSVKLIGDRAFWGCAITSITIPNSVTKIGNAAFRECKNLTSITIPSSVAEIERAPFPECDSLKSINVSEDNRFFMSKDGVLFSLDGTRLIQYPAGKGGSSYTIPSSVTEIGGQAFYLCDDLTTLTIPGKVKRIGWLAFSGCNGLTSITIPNSVKEIAGCAFTKCDNLTSVTIPDSVTQIDWRTFADCSKLQTVRVSEGTMIARDAFENCPWQPPKD